jgi:hypothetical protein
MASQWFFILYLCMGPAFDLIVAILSRKFKQKLSLLSELIWFFLLDLIFILMASGSKISTAFRMLHATLMIAYLMIIFGRLLTSLMKCDSFEWYPISYRVIWSPWVSRYFNYAELAFYPKLDSGYALLPLDLGFQAHCVIKQLDLG